MSRKTRGHSEQDLASAPYDRSVLVRQFALSKWPDRFPEGWRGESLRNWHLVTHPDDGLPILPLSSGHQQIGWLVGYPVDSRTGLLRDGWTLPNLRDSDQLEADLEEAIYSMSGRFAAVVLLRDLERLYLDPFGSLAAVYSATQKMAGSTTSLLPQEDERDPSRYDPAHDSFVSRSRSRRMITGTHSVSRIAGTFSASCPTTFSTWSRGNRIVTGRSQEGYLALQTTSALSTP